MKIEMSGMLTGSMLSVVRSHQRAGHAASSHGHVQHYAMHVRGRTRMCAPLTKLHVLGDDQHGAVRQVVKTRRACCPAPAMASRHHGGTEEQRGTQPWRPSTLCSRHAAFSDGLGRGVGGWTSNNEHLFRESGVDCCARLSSPLAVRGCISHGCNGTAPALKQAEQPYMSAQCRID